MTRENNQCSSAYTTTLKEGGLSESEMLLELAVLQFNCFRDMSRPERNPNAFRLDQQIIISKKMKYLMEKLESKFLGIGQYSTFATFILIQELDDTASD